MLAPSVYNYAPHHDLRAALQHRFLLGFNTQDITEPRHEGKESQLPTLAACLHVPLDLRIPSASRCCSLYKAHHFQVCRFGLASTRQLAEADTQIRCECDTIPRSLLCMFLRSCKKAWYQSEKKNPISDFQSDYGKIASWVGSSSCGGAGANLTGAVCGSPPHMRKICACLQASPFSSSRCRTSRVLRTIRWTSVSMSSARSRTTSKVR